MLHNCVVPFVGVLGGGGIRLNFQTLIIKQEQNVQLLLDTCCELETIIQIVEVSC